MESNLLLPFLHATRDGLLAQFHFSATAAEPISLHQRESTFDVIAATCFSTSQKVGSYVICFPESVYLALLGKMFGTKVSTVTEDGKDGAIEVINIIMSLAKRMAAERGYSVQRTGPIFTLWGKTIDTRYLSVGETLVIPFSSAAGEFSVELSIEPRIP